jgi:TonB family protein
VYFRDNMLVARASQSKSVVAGNAAFYLTAKHRTTMKNLGQKLLLGILVCGLFQSASIAQQKHRRTPRNKNVSRPVYQPSVVEREAPEEQERIMQECDTSGEPPPDIEYIVDRRSVLCGKAISLPKPAYPPEAKAAKASGTVVVEAIVDETGRVIWARPLSGHPLLLQAAKHAAYRARYSPEMLYGKPVKVRVQIYYNFQL